jgi:hypothetical protein
VLGGWELEFVLMNVYQATILRGGGFGIWWGLGGRFGRVLMGAEVSDSMSLCGC